MSCYVVYLLCMPNGRGDDAHYVGITTPDRLAKRLMEHRTGRGAKRTARACLNGERWFHAKSFGTCDPTLEKTLQAHPDLAGLCPICSQGLVHPPQIPYNRPVEPVETRQLAFPTRP